MAQRGSLERAAPWAAAAALSVLGLYRFGPMLRGLSTHFADFQALHGNQLFNEVADSRLNAWILAWVEHAATTSSAIWNSNTFHPAPNMLAGSEHLFGVLAQLLPFLPFASNAVALHQAALLLSSALLCATTYAAVRWATASTWAAFLAAAFALMMPWRVTELAHLQLSSAQFLPVIWLCVVRGLLGASRRRDLIALGVCTTLQLLSSFYLAYFLTISSAVLVATVSVVARPAWRDVVRLGAAVVPGFALFGLSALPYLQRQATADLASHYDPDFSIGLFGAVSTIAPRWPFGWELLNQPANYWTPWAVAAFALFALFCFGRGRFRSIEDAAERRRHALVLGLAAIVLTSLVMMVGGSLEVFGERISMPAKWLGAVLPGFSMLRGPTRWGILAAVALPILAGLGVFAVDRLCRQRLWARGVLACASAITFAWFAIPTHAAWPDAELTERRYAAVNALPRDGAAGAEGALLEMPWPMAGGSIDLASRSILMSTLHWRPLLNGYTGHRPRSYRFLQRIGARLPSAAALDELRRLTRLRFILLDATKMAPRELRPWAEAARTGQLRLVHNDAQTRIYELAGWERGGELVSALVSGEPRATTFNGLSRRPLDFGTPTPEANAMGKAGGLAGSIAGAQTARGHNPTLLRISNASSQDWPGFDIDEEGLVRVRYSYLPVPGGDADERETVTRLAGIETDVPAGATRNARVLIQSPREAGEYELCIDLVQQFGGVGGAASLRRLPIEPRRQRVRVAGKTLDSELARMIDSAFVRGASPPACGTQD